GAALDDGFESPQNRPITWRHLLHQTSEWEGTLWGKPDSVDHHRDVGRSELGGGKGPARALRPPGTFWEYNDVRVNRLSLSLLQLFRRPLAEVLRRAVMDLIGAGRRQQPDLARSGPRSGRRRPLGRRGEGRRLPRARPRQRRRVSRLPGASGGAEAAAGVQSGEPERGHSIAA